jgi:hypothetical protein
MKVSPGERPGHDREGSCPRPFPGNLSLGGNWFRVLSYSARRQNRFDETRRPVSSPLPFDTGRYSRSSGCMFRRLEPLSRDNSCLYICLGDSGLVELNIDCVRRSTGRISRFVKLLTRGNGSPQPPHPPRSGRLELAISVARPGDRRESPAALVAARYVEVGGSGGIPGGWQRRSRPVGTGNDDGGKPQRRLSVARLTPFPVSCLLRHLSGSATPMLAGTGVKRAKSGVGR